MILNDLNDPQWPQWSSMSSMILNDPQWSSMILNDAQWSSMNLNEPQWSSAYAINMELFHIILIFVTIYLLIKRELIQGARTTHLNNVHLNPKISQKKIRWYYILWTPFEID